MKTSIFVKPNIKILLIASSWLVLISLLHHCNNMESYSFDKFKIGFLPITCHLLLPVAMHRETADINIEPIKFSSWPDMIEALKGGEIDGAFILAPIAMAMIEQGVPLKIVLLGHRDGTGLVVRANEKIKNAAGLAGKTVAIPIRYSNQNIALLRLLDKYGVNRNKTNIVELPPPDMPSALSAGAIDAYIVGEPYAAWAELAGTGKVLYHMKDFWPGFISSVLVMREDIINEKRKSVNTMIKLIYHQGEWIEKNRIKAAIIGADFFGLSEELLTYVLSDPINRVNYKRLIPEKKDLDEIADFMIKYKLLTEYPKNSRIIDTSWR